MGAYRPLADAQLGRDLFVQVAARDQVQLQGFRPRLHEFDVVPAFTPPASGSLRANLSLSEATYEDVQTSAICCASTNSCGSECYVRKQQQTAHIDAELLLAQDIQVPPSQLEWKVVSVDTGAANVCVGCSALRGLVDTVARARYCYEISARLLAGSSIWNVVVEVDHTPSAFCACERLGRRHSMS